MAAGRAAKQLFSGAENVFLRFPAVRKDIRNGGNNGRYLWTQVLRRSSTRKFNVAVTSLVGTFGGLWFISKVACELPTVTAKSKDEKDEKKNPEGMSRREKRFHEFASCEYNGQIVMTPHDFIESLIENQPKIHRTGKIRLTQRDVDVIIKNTPNLANGSNTFFRDLHQEGIITYSEYLFLVTILTKSNAGLKTALKMMDENSDKEISLKEFQLIETMINKSASKATRSSAETGVPHTTLLLHLFGTSGTQVVTFERFFKFMDDLQAEVLELEFHEYSKSMKAISEIDFAKILLRNTTLTEAEYCEYIDRLKNNIQIPKGITMNQFKAFHKFLSNIEDFIIAVNMTNLMHQPVSKDLFTRSIKVTTGEDIDPYVIDVVFKLFDQDGDGHLSQNEFIGIMKDRLKRGFGKFPNTKGIDGFKHCLKKEMSKPVD